MAIPIIIGAIALNGYLVKRGVDKRKEAENKIKEAERRNYNNIERLKRCEIRTEKALENLKTCTPDFNKFSILFEKFKNKPEFSETKIGEIILPKFDEHKLQEVSISGVAKGAVLVIAFGLVGGIAFDFLGSKIKEKADLVWTQMKENEEKINKNCLFLQKLEYTADDYTKLLLKVIDLYNKHLVKIEEIIFFHKTSAYEKIDWDSLSLEDRITIENTINTVSILYEMRKIELAKKIDDNSDPIINSKEIKKLKTSANIILEKDL